MFGLFLIVSAILIGETSHAQNVKCYQSVQLLTAGNLNVGSMNRNVAVPIATDCRSMLATESLRYYCDANKAPALPLTNPNSTVITKESVARVTSSVIVVESINGVLTRSVIPSVSYLCPTLTVAQEQQLVITRLNSLINSLYAQIASLKNQIAALQSQVSALQSQIYQYATAPSSAGSSESLIGGSGGSFGW